MSEVFEQHKDGTPNYECRVLLDKTDKGQPITRSALRAACRGLFENLSLISGLACDLRPTHLQCRP